MKKPTPPTWAELEHDDRVARAAAALGFEVEADRPLRTEQVYRAAIEAAKKKRGPVTPSEIARHAGIPTGTVAGRISELLVEFRILRVGHGLYLPVLPEATASAG